MDANVLNRTSMEKGKTMVFGGYEWLVLDVQNDRALLITKEIVEKRTYNTTNEAVTWERCTLRAYLNDVFYNRFSDDEKQRIQDANLLNRNNPAYGTDGGQPTCDKVFLLSIEEANTYFQNDLDPVAAYRVAARWWWLRSPGIGNHAAFVDKDGFVNVHGYRVDYAYTGVRPAVYLKIG